MDVSKVTHKGDRPVGRHIMEFLKQNVGIGYRIADLITEMAKLGYRHGGNPISDNCKILIEQGLIVEREQHYGIPKEGDITIPEPSPKQSPPPVSKPKPPKPEQDHCDKCHRKFEHGDKFYVRSFGNVRLYLCAECHKQKATVTSIA